VSPMGAPITIAQKSKNCYNELNFSTLFGRSNCLQKGAPL
jgi:hypothetical protein